jgi:hypothetical protein
MGSSLGALLVTLEHRWYGQSLPGELSDTPLLMATLSVDQVMEDLEGFVAFMNTQVLAPQTCSSWLAIGGSYAGALSAWVRSKKPDTFDASWSSSGVVNAIFNFTAFDDTVVSVLDDTCASSLRQVMADATTQWTSGLAPRYQLLKLFGTPTYFTQQDFLWMLADSSAMGPQYGAKDVMCSFMKQSFSPLENFRNFTVSHYGPDFTSNCYYSTACLSGDSMTDQWADADYSWVYQTCSELAYWQAWSSATSIRSPLLDTNYFVTQCHKAFGRTVNADTVAFNNNYGGATPNATKVIALQGSDDPWQPAGVQASRPDYPTFTAECDGCGHCGDLGLSQDPAIQAQQAQIKTYLTTWLR